MPIVLHPFRRKNFPARIPETAFPDPYLFTDTERAIVDDIPALLNKNGLTSHQLPNLLEPLVGSLRWDNGWRRGQRTE